MVMTRYYNLFNAFFLLAPAVSFAVLFTALEVAVVAVFPVTLASAVPKGEGCRSFCLSPSVVREPLLVEVGRVLDGEALRGWVEDADVASFDVVVGDGILRVGVIIDSTDGWG